MPRDGQRQQVEVERVAVIVRRALEMTAVSGDLPVDLSWRMRRPVAR